jgi:ceramide glucosyltransferase
MRVSRPVGYLASGVTQPCAAVILSLMVSGCSLAGFGAIGLLYAVRCSVALVYSRLFLRDAIFPRWLWLLPLRDAIAFVTWGLAFVGNRVTWRGHRFRVMAGGTLREIG